ncbi:MAG TPA: ABC transporter permease subunit, partial [Pirellulales bacterium]|nr:ABC transporter permease subunit [Pirellulales bacterium]
EGGGPYVYPDKNGVLRGFEVELADMLAAELGVKAQFQQGDWAQLPLLLDAKNVDVVLNGYESTPERQEKYLCTRPYYVYGLQLLVRRDSSIRDWTALEKSEGRAPVQVGVLGGSGAETYLRKNERLNVGIVTFNGVTDAMERVRSNALAATLQDDCAAIFYADQFPELRRVGRLVGEGSYVAMVGKNETRLHAALNDALGRIIADGRLKQLYDRWDLSGKTQMLALADAEKVAPVATSPGFFEVFRENIGILLESAGMTVLLSVTSMPLAIIVGILVAIGRLYGPWPVAKPLGLYVELLRGTPLMLQLYAIFFLLPKIGIAIPAFAAAIAGLAINYSAYEAEIYRAGLQAIPRGQMEAALSLGMSRGLAIRRIILPQAFRIVIPPVTNDFIALFKDTSVCSVVTIVELT